VFDKPNNLARKEFSKGEVCWLYWPRLAVSAELYPQSAAESRNREPRPKADTASIKQRPKAEQTPKAAAERRI